MGTRGLGVLHVASRLISSLIENLHDDADDLSIQNYNWIAGWTGTAI